LNHTSTTFQTGSYAHCHQYLRVDRHYKIVFALNSSQKLVSSLIPSASPTVGYELHRGFLAESQPEDEVFAVFGGRETDHRKNELLECTDILMAGIPREPKVQIASWLCLLLAATMIFCAPS